MNRSSQAFAQLFFLFFSLTTLAQQGDHAGETQLPPKPEWIRPAPPLSAEEELKTFKVAAGYRVELVAAEPLVVSPVAAAWDADGRMWVVEMRGFMPNVDGKGEEEPIGRIVILEDTDGDGRMDKSTVFLDGLVLPRAICLVRDGALVAEPPNLWFCRDTNGDGKCDEKTLVANDYGGRQSPEHTANSLVLALDNWIYSADHTVRFRYVNGKWERDVAAFRGQWGLTQDDGGRFFYNTNSDQLRGDLVPCYAAHYFSRNKNYRSTTGLNVQITKDQSVWPIHPTPGVNRGYQKGQLRDDGTLATFTAACAPCIYRGNLFPEDARGNAFLAEPSANLIRRNILTENGLALTARNAYDKAEFLASTDERFRPVNLYSGPDGALYVVDLYRGVLQHRIFVTSYLRKQMLERGLDKPLNLGRIWRIVPEGKKTETPPKLAKMTSAQLVEQLSHPNGWMRDTAQRLLVERQDKSVVLALRQLVENEKDPLGCLHALWTLDGLVAFDDKCLLSALSHSNARIKSSAIRFSERWINISANPSVTLRLGTMISDPEPLVQLQLAFLFSERKTEWAEAYLAKILKTHGDDPLIRDAVISGLGGRELEFIVRLDPKQKDVLARLAACVIVEGKPERIAKLLDTIATQTDLTAQQALLDGCLSAQPKPDKGQRAKLIKISAEPKSLLALADGNEKTISDRAKKFAAILVWPGKAGMEPEKIATPLTAEQQKLWDQGKTLFKATCAQCHGEDGMGIDGKAPPQVGSAWILGSEQRNVRIVLHGLRGPITVQGKKYEMEMPAFGAAFDDTQIAAILTYLRREWGYQAEPIAPARVTQIRKTTEKRENQWTEKELLEIK